MTSIRKLLSYLFGKSAPEPRQRQLPNDGQAPRPQREIIAEVAATTLGDLPILPTEPNGYSPNRFRIEFGGGVAP